MSTVRHIVLLFAALFCALITAAQPAALVEANRQQLTESGIPAGNIEASGLCTACRTDAFFSYRRSGGITGRQINFMMIKSGSVYRTYFADGPDCLH